MWLLPGGHRLYGISLHPGPGIAVQKALEKPSRPRVIGGYRLDEQIGSGAMGAVYRAYDLALGRTVALKIVAADDETSELFLRFVQEGAAAARIRHPNVVQVYDAGSEGGFAYLAMQLLEGETLAACLARRGRLPMTTAIDYTLPICSALMAAHAAGVLHRDLKPANIFLADWGRTEPEPYLLDFGISKLEGPTDAILTQNPQFLGTPFYIAPEQADGAPGSAWSDQYALALCVYESLLGVRPFEEHKSSLMKLLRHVAQGGIVAPRQLDASVPLGLDAALVQALSTTPADRFASMQEFGAALLPYASPTQRELWKSAFITVDDHTMASARAPVVQSSSRFPSEPPTDPVGFAPDQSSLSQRGRGPSARSTKLQEEPTTAETAEAAALASHGAVSPISSRRFNSVGVEQHVRREPVRSVFSHVLVALLGVCTVVMTVGLIEDEWHERTQPTYSAEVIVSPEDAAISLDGTTLSRGSLSIVLPKDGQRHELIVSHPDYEPAKVLFQDAPPTKKIALRLLPQLAVDPEPKSVAASHPSKPDRAQRATPRRPLAAELEPVGLQDQPAIPSSPDAPRVEVAATDGPAQAVAALEETVDPGANQPSDNPEAAHAKTPAPPKIRTGNLDPWAD